MEMKTILFWLGVLLTAIAFGSGCNSSDESPAKLSDSSTGSTQNSVAAMIKQGEELAAIHCSTCHLQPDPRDLPTDRWHFTIKWMGHYLGHETFGPVDITIVFQSLMPEEEKVTKEELHAIKKYYESASGPETPSDKIVSPGIAETRLFKPQNFSTIPNGGLISCIKIDETRKRIFVANSDANAMNEFDFEKKSLNAFPTEDTQVVGLTLTDDGFVATLIGDLFQNVDNGAIVIGTQSKHSPMYNLDAVVRNYYRLAHCCVADINGDGLDDYLASGFGANHDGAFSVLLTPQKGINWERPPKRIDLIKQPGTICSEAFDFDKDGDLDILALTTQGSHDMWYFENDYNQSGRFVAKRIWKNRPSFGANGFRLADLNNDGEPEIIVVCGNNMEMKHPPTRPYHGVRIYKNSGNMKFDEVFFQALPGAVQTTVSDFNGDGKPDIAVVSSQPDWRLEKPVSFLLLEQQEELNFSVASVTELNGTQWLSLDSGDIDDDGDIDIILGGMNWVPELKPQERANFQNAVVDQATLLILENTSTTN